MKQDKNTLKFFAIALGLTGIYLIISKLSKGATKKSDVIKGDWSKYVVKTMGSPLNVRESASVSSKVVDSLSNGSEIWARPSVVNGWLQVSKDSISPIGFVSEAYLKLSSGVEGIIPVKRVGDAFVTPNTNLDEVLIVIPIKYVVKTSGDALNVRKEPNSSSVVVKKYPNGTVINARKSQVSGWHEVLEQGLGVVGYVSSQYIVKK
jgi:uncharacterized protein YgiM (DUF1202 family)